MNQLSSQTTRTPECDGLKKIKSQSFKRQGLQGTLFLCLMAFILVCLAFPNRAYSQCQPGVNVPVYPVDLVTATNGVVIGSYNLGDECCPIQGNNSCLILDITVGTEFSGVGLCFDPPCSVVGYLFSDTDTDFCVPAIGQGFDVCGNFICTPPAGTSFSLMLCKPGAANQPLTLTVFGVAMPDMNVNDVTEGCTTTFEVTGATQFTCNGGSAPPTETPLTLTWTTNTPGALAYLSCTDCANPTFEYTGPPVTDCNGLHIMYTVSIPATECFGPQSVTKTVTIYPDISGAITTDCTPDNQTITLTFNPDLPCPDLVYEWTDMNNMVVGTMSSITVPADGNQYCVSVSRTDAPLCNPFDSCALALCCQLEVLCPSENGGVFACVEDVPAPDPTLITIVDSCGAVSITSSDVSTGTGCMLDTMMIMRSYIISDGMNMDTCNQLFKVVDDVAPVINCPADISVQCDNLVPSPSTTAVTTSDNCDGIVTVVFVGDVISGQTCDDRYTITRTYSATDECGNSATCAQIINVFDSTPPMITCPANVTVQCASLVPAADITAVVTSDNCGGIATVTVAADVISNQTCANRYTVTRVYTATDDCGNTATCAQIITVFDNTAPMLTCPANVTVQCASLVPAVNIAAVTSTDNCGGTATITHVGDVITNQTCTNRYTVTRTYRATDECGNSATCAQIITVFDNTAPMITCPANVTVQCANLVPAANTAAVVTSDNCGGTATVTVAADVISNQTCANRYTVTRVYTATDACGNTATCAQIITVFDNTVPMLTCPANVTVQCANLVPAVNTGAVTSTDNCGGTATITHVGDVITNQTCTDRFTVTRTYRATDECGNSATCAQIITVFDNTAPTITCPANVTVQCANQVPAASPTAAIASDNCGGGANITFAPDVITNQTCANRYTINRVYTATDACGNTATCAQIITVFDNTVPMLTCPANVTVQCANLVPAVNIAAVTSTDNCGGTATITHDSDVITNQTCANRYTITRTYRATDECGNSATCAQIITVFDNTAPMLTCPANVTVQCASLVPAVNIAAVTSTDNCGGTATITHVGDVITNQTCANRYTVTRTYRATDECGNSATCAQVITVFDNTAPMITCPANVTVQCASLVPAANTAAVVTSDNCGGTATVTVAADVISNQTCANRYTVTRVYTATDVCGNTATCAQIITVFDNTVPMLTCPANVTVQCANLVPAVNTAAVTSTDNCGGTVTITHVGDVITNQTCTDRFTVTRTYRATDECGNSATCAQIITVFDNTPPSITCPANVTVQCAGQVPTPSTTAVVSSDNCGGATTVVFVGDVISNQTCANRYLVTRTYQATDACGNTATCTQLITVFDNTAPIITCPANITVNCEDSSLPPATGVATATDNCGGTPTIAYNDLTIPGMCPQESTTFRTWTATDSCGNSATCIQVVMVQDTTAPVLIGVPADVTVQCDSVPPSPIVTATDNCTENILVLPASSLIPGNCPNNYTIFRSWVAIDECGNSSSASQTVTVIDTVAPVLMGVPANVTVQCNAVPPPAMVTATDNCTDPQAVVFTENTIPGNCPSNYTLIRNWTATDECGNSSSSSQTVVVIDTQAPVLMGVPANVTVQCNAVPPPAMVAATDNCTDPQVVVFVETTIPGNCPSNYTLIRTWTATDSCGNSASATQTLNVIDTQPPVLMGVPANVTVQCNAVPPPAMVTATDNCTDPQAVVFVENTIPGNCPSNYTLIRNWTATDSCGNSASATQTIVVVDTQPPVLMGVPANVTVQCNAVPPPAMVTATDNCTDPQAVVFVETTIQGNCPNNYTLIRNWTATDSCGNSASATQTVTVIDTQAPSITCPANVTVQCASQVPAVNTAAVITSDNCAGTVTVTHVGDVITNQTCVNRFTLTRTYRATDVCGNSATCAQTITVFDNTAPTLTCPANVTVQCASQVPAVNTGAVTSTDNCGGTATITHVGDVITNQTCVNRFTLTRTYRATDECGNSATCAQVITVFDNTPPALTCPANVTVQCASQVPAVNTGAVTSTDNCGGTATITHVGDVITNQTCVNRFTLTRTYRATDACGNSATCAQVITVFDNTVPSITCPANVTVQCASQVPPVNTGSVVTSDNCGGTVTVTHVGDVITNMTCINRFTLTRTYRATDECGNSATCSQVITVFDNTPPVITFDDPLLEGVQNGGTIEVQCFGQDPEWELPSFDEGSIDVTDNCAGTVTVVFMDNLIDEGNCEQDGYINLYRLDWVATDACGNSSSAFVFLALIDTIPPQIQNVPADITVNCDEIPAPPTDIFATDECLCACVILFDESDPAPGCQNGQVVTRTWTAEDDCGNVTVEVQNITLIDNEGPELIMMLPELAGVQDGAIFEYTCNEGGIPQFFDELSAESVNSPVSCGTSGNISFNSETIIANNCKFWGYIENRTYTWDAVDQCGNTTSLVITARVIDTEAPSIVGAPDTTCVGDPALNEIEVVDNCNNASLIYWDVPIPNPCGPGTGFRRTYEGYDDCGNTVRDTVILVPNDGTQPLMEFVNPKLAALEPGEVLEMDCVDRPDGHYTPFNMEDVVVTDDCMGGMSLKFDEVLIEGGNCDDGIIASLYLIWSATDACGNNTDLVVPVNIVDKTPPQFVNTEFDVTIGCGDELPGVFAEDNCGHVSIIFNSVEIIPGDCEYEYDVIRELMAVDPCGNTTTKTQVIHVGDGSGPIIEGVIEEVCDDLTIPEVTALDPCTGEFVEVTMVQDTLDIPCNDGMVIERIWSAVDACGNVAQVKQHIVIGDQTAPEIQVPTNSVILRFYDYLDNLVLLSQENIMDLLNDLNAGSVFVLDDCDQEIEPVFNLVVTYADDCEEDGYFERRVYSWIATDVCGNSDEISFTVDIMDDIPPVLMGVPENTTIICDDLPPVPVVTGQDPALPVVVEYSQIMGNGDGPGEFVVARTWTATDACGNSSQATQDILWIPDTFLDCDILLPGAVECNTHGVVIGSDVFGGLGEVSYLWEIEGEKCFIQSGQGTPEILIYVGWSEVDIKLTVTDEFGCTSACSITLNCLDPFENNFGINPQIIHPETNVSPTVVDRNAKDLVTLQHFNLWPNPANTTVTISFESLIEDEVEFVLTNFLGQVVMYDKIDAIKGFNSRKIDVSTNPEGAYLLQLKTENQVYTKPIIIMRND